MDGRTVRLVVQIVSALLRLVIIMSVMRLGELDGEISFLEVFIP